MGEPVDSTEGGFEVDQTSGKDGRRRSYTHLTVTEH